MFISNQIPQTDLSRPVCEEVLEEIQARLDAGWRVKGDLQLLIDFACDVIEQRKKDATRCRDYIGETRCTACGRVCQGVSCPQDGCSQSHSPVSQDSLG